MFLFEITVDDWPDLKNNVAFSNLSAVVQTMPSYVYCRLSFLVFKKTLQS